MTDSLTIRLVHPEDYSGILDIYAPYIQHTAISFEYDVPSFDDFSRRIEEVIAFHPWLIAAIKDQIIGYAYAGKHRTRKAYQWSAESSVYIAADYHGRGIGKVLYQALFQVLRLQGIINVYAGITLPNIKSESFHTAMGFTPVGIYHAVGYKFEKWHDVLWMEMSLHHHTNLPPAPRSWHEIEKTDDFQKIFE